MNLPALFAAIALTAYLATLAIAAASAPGSKKMPRTSAALILGAMAIMAFVSLSNTLEATGAFTGFDQLEDYIEVLVFPMLGYAYVLMHMDGQMKRLQATVKAGQAEHDLLLGILDTSRVGILLVDDLGCVTFANEFAETVLGVTECGPAHECSTEVRLVPPGVEPPERVVVHESIQGRTIENEVWEIVTRDGRQAIGLAASPLEESSGRSAGSVVVLMRVPPAPSIPEG